MTSGGYHFFNFFVFAGLEEIVARWFFLSVLTQLPGLGGTFGFYLMFLLGNSLWAFIHIYNFKKHHDRSLWRVLPQFVSGFFFTYVYVKFGLFEAIVTHLGCNAVVFSAHKVQDVTPGDLLAIVYCGIVAAVAYYNFDQDWADLSKWWNPPAEVSAGLTSKETFMISGWDFWDYVLAATAISFAWNMVFHIFLFDWPYSKKSDKNEDVDPWAAIVGVAILMALAVGMVYGAYWVTGWFTDDFLTRILAVAVFFAMLNRCRSGSAVARSFWVSLPMSYLSICVLHALGFWQACAYMLVSFLVSTPLHKIRAVEDWD